MRGHGAENPIYEKIFTFATKHGIISALRHFGTSALRHFGTSALRHFGTSALHNCVDVSDTRSRVHFPSRTVAAFPFFALILATLVLLPIAAPAADFSATVKAIKNGDTIVVTTRDNRDITIQLYGIDAPEGRQPGGKNATEALSAMLPGGMDIRVSPIERDRYKRTVSIVYAGDENVNARMIEVGWAKVSTRFCNLPICAELSRLEQEARASLRGIWGGDGEPIPPRRKQEDAFSATVMRVTDGDTLVVRDRDNKEITIRLYGIDTPEGDQTGGENATEALSAMIADGMDIHVLPVDRDRYKRTVAIVYADNELVNARMIEAGWAWMYSQFCKVPVCEEWGRLEQEARASRRGLWREAEPTPPWVYRAEKRKTDK